jgi:cell division protein FtsL
MKVEKRLLLRLFFTAEVIIFVIIYLVGSHGAYAVMQLQQENKDIELSIVQAEEEIKKIEQEIVAWKNNQDFFIQKIAREQLQLAHEQDRIYYK